MQRRSSFIWALRFRSRDCCQRASSISAIVILAALINLLLIELLLREVIAGEFLSGSGFQRFSFYALPAISALLWWALERRLTRLRKAGMTVAKLPETSDREDALRQSDTLA